MKGFEMNERNGCGGGMAINLEIHLRQSSSAEGHLGIIASSILEQRILNNQLDEGFQSVTLLPKI